MKRRDKSKKGTLDRLIKPLVDLINSMDNYYTTSSCSGRIILIYRKNLKKSGAKWLFSSHDKVKFDDIKPALKDIPDEDLWFKEEPAIIHVCCETIKDAQDLVDLSRESGFKRTGIQSTRKRINVEIGSSEVIDAIIAVKGKLIVTDDYLKTLIKKANEKIEINLRKIDKLYKKIKKKIIIS